MWEEGGHDVGSKYQTVLILYSLLKLWISEYKLIHLVNRSCSSSPFGSFQYHESINISVPVSVCIPPQKTWSEKTTVGHCLVQLVEQASQVQRLRPRCSGPGFKSRPGALCCLSCLQAVLSIKAIKAKKIYKKKKEKPMDKSSLTSSLLGQQSGSLNIGVCQSSMFVCVCMCLYVSTVYRENGLWGSFWAVQQGTVAVALESSRTDPAMSAWHSLAPSLCFPLSLCLCLSLSLAHCFFSSVLLFTVSLLSVLLHVFLHPFGGSVFPFSLCACLSLSLSPSRKRGSVEGSPQSSNTPIIAFWSLWHDEVCQGEATHNRAHAHSDTHTDLRKKKHMRIQKRTRTHAQRTACRETHKQHKKTLHTP